MGDLDRLLDATEYKEKYRGKMIQWGEDKRRQDPGYFCRLASSGPGCEAPVWVISDARRHTDVQDFEEHYADRVLRIRVQAEDSVRQQRGWHFTPGIDDAESECGLDDITQW